jgi:arginase family enzyme
VDRPVSARITVLRGRTSDRSAGPGEGAQALGEELARRLGVTAAQVGAPEPPRDGRWEDDVRAGRQAIAAAGRALEEALDAGELPVLLASDCTIAMGTLPALARREPSARVVWLDAHGDFNTPSTTESGFLGGMCLAAACGSWDDGIDGALDPGRVVIGDGRDLDPAEREELDQAGVTVLRAAQVAAAVRGERVFVHLDFDVLDPGEMPATFPAPGGLTRDALRVLLAELSTAAHIVGIELTAAGGPEHAAKLADVVEPSLRG